MQKISNRNGQTKPKPTISKSSVYTHPAAKTASHKEIIRFISLIRDSFVGSIDVYTL